MKEIIKIGDIEVEVSNNVAWTMEYRDQFNKDIMETLMPAITTLIETVSTVLSESGEERPTRKEIAEAIQGRAFDITLPLSQLSFTDSVINVVWAMAKAADETIAPPKKWVRQFDEFPLDVIVPQVANLIMKGFSSSKNFERLRTLIESAMKTTQPTKTTK